MSIKDEMFRPSAGRNLIATSRAFAARLPAGCHGGQTKTPASDKEPCRECPVWLQAPLPQQSGYRRKTEALRMTGAEMTLSFWDEISRSGVGNLYLTQPPGGHREGTLAELPKGDLGALTAVVRQIRTRVDGVKV
jgi:hypothetical protein